MKLKLGRLSASARAVVENVFDKATWKVLAADTLIPEERRRLTIAVNADFQAGADLQQFRPRQ